jgi:hypothetical protein
MSAVRAMISVDGVAITLTRYSAAGATGLTTLSPRRPSSLAGELIETGLPRLR